MDRMGHDSQRAAMIYLHGSDARQHAIADSPSKITRDELKRAGGPGAGSDRARHGHATAIRHPEESGQKAWTRPDLGLGRAPWARLERATGC
jgi:hypothetical protein